MLRNSLKSLFLVLALLLVLPQNAHAYIDPGSGSMLLQLLLAGVAGIGMAGKLYWRRMMGFFKKTPTNSSGSSEQS